MFHYRDHRGGLAESLKTQQTFATRKELVDYLRRDLSKYSFPVRDSDVLVEKYGKMPDTRMNPPWNTHIVVVHNFGPVGFTDGPVEE